MKKVLAILLALSVLALSACTAKQENPDTQEEAPAETTVQPALSDGTEEAEQDQQPAQEGKRIEPLAESLNLDTLTDATVAASFGAADISEKDGRTEITLTVYDYDLYDMVDIAQLAAGDTIVANGKEMTVTSREDADGLVTINGGTEQGGMDLTTDDLGVYYAVGPDDAKSYHALGEITVPVADGFALTDHADPEHPDAAYTAADLAKLADDGIGFTAGNTQAVIEQGELTALIRSYTP